MDFYDRYEFHLSFTGTYKQCLVHPMVGNKSPKEYLTIEEANKTLTRFAMTASRSIFGCSQAKKGKRLVAVGYIEGNIRAAVSAHERIHTHLSIGGPIADRFDLTDPEQAYKLENILKQQWNKTKWGYDEVDIRLIDNREINNTELPFVSRDRWQGYIHKKYDHKQSERMVMFLPKSSKND